MRKKLAIMAIIGALAMTGGDAFAKDKKNPTAEEIMKALQQGKTVTITRRGHVEHPPPGVYYSPQYPLGYYPPAYYYAPPPGVYIYQGNPYKNFDNTGSAAGYLTGRILERR